MTVKVNVESTFLCRKCSPTAQGVWNNVKVNAE
jgi:hypothetical protein